MWNAQLEKAQVYGIVWRCGIWQLRFEEFGKGKYEERTINKSAYHNSYIITLSFSTLSHCAYTSRLVVVNVIFRKYSRTDPVLRAAFSTRPSQRGLQCGQSTTMLLTRFKHLSKWSQFCRESYCKPRSFFSLSADSASPLNVQMIQFVSRNASPPNLEARWS